MKIVSLMLPANLKNMDSRKKTVIATNVKKKLPKNFVIHFKLYTIKDFGQISFKRNFLLRKISKEVPNLQLATVVLSLKLPARELLITIKHGNIVTLVARSLDKRLSWSLGKIVRNNFFLRGPLSSIYITFFHNKKLITKST